MLRLPLLALIAFVLPATADPSWTFQQLNNPFVGEHTGVKVYDLNHDGYPDLLFSAVRDGGWSCLLPLHLHMCSCSLSSTGTPQH